MPDDHSVEAYLRRRTIPELLSFLQKHANGHLPEEYDDATVQLVRDEVMRRAKHFDEEPCPE